MLSSAVMVSLRAALLFLLCGSLTACGGAVEPGVSSVDGEVERSPDDAITQSGSEDIVPSALSTKRRAALPSSLPWLIAASKFVVVAGGAENPQSAACGEGGNATAGEEAEAASPEGEEGSS